MKAMARPLQKSSVTLPNGVFLQSFPLPKSKGRHWVATYDGGVIGEFRTWQQTTYLRQPEGDYGRGGGSYETSMVRESWLAGPFELGESKDQPNTERMFHDWKDTLKTLSHPLVRKISVLSA